MKHLQKYNEAKTDYPDFYQYCKYAFAEMIDNNVAKTFDKHKLKNEVVISIKKPKNEDISLNYDNFHKRIEEYKNWLDILEETYIALKRLKDEYNNVDFNIREDVDGKMIIYIKLTSEKIKPYQKYLSPNELRKKMGLPLLGLNYQDNANDQQEEDLDEEEEL